MKFLSLLHRWTGGMVGLLLAILALSGTALLWEDSWILVDGASDLAAVDPQSLARAIDTAYDAGPRLLNITFASDDFGLHQAIYADGGGAYISQNGVVAARWTRARERPELWLFEVHHYLLIGETGKVITGILGILLIAFTITGQVLRWRTRRTFRFRLWPARYSTSAIVRHHRDLGAVASPLLILAAATGTLMVFPEASAIILSPLAASNPKPNLPDGFEEAGKSTDWRTVMANAGSIFPEAEPRRLMVPSTPGDPISIRYKHYFEWTPNGRSYVWIDPANAAVVGANDPVEQDAASAVIEKFYPIHAAKVGGLAWRLTMTFAGLALAALGILVTLSFWIKNLRTNSALPL